MIRLLLDQGLPFLSAGLLREAGIDATHVAEVGMAQSLDEEILQFARREKRAVVTLDSDFHKLLALNAGRSPSVIRIRIEGLAHRAAARLITAISRKLEDDLAEGVVATVTERRTRIRRLPIRGT